MREPPRDLLYLDSLPLYCSGEEGPDGAWDPQWAGSWESESRSVVSDSLRPRGLYSPWNSLGQNTLVGSHSRLQGIFPTQGLNPGLPPCRWILYQLSHKENPLVILAVANKTTLQKIKQKFYYKK